MGIPNRQKYYARGVYDTEGKRGTSIFCNMWGIYIRNIFVGSEQNVNEKWANIETVYQKRANLIPKLEKTLLAANSGLCNLIFAMLKLPLF
jgi:hypothetical protein